MRRRVLVDSYPFSIGRQPDNALVLLDDRISRNHARLVLSEGGLAVEDLGSRHGLYVNGQRVTARPLALGDSIEFGQGLGWRVEVTREVDASDPLARLREVLEVSRSLERTNSPGQILDRVVDAALKITGSERGFLFLRCPQGWLRMEAARDAYGQALSEDDLRVPRALLTEALEKHRDPYVMNFDGGTGGIDPTQTVVALDLVSSVFVPLPRAGGVLYFDSRAERARLGHGDRELLQTLALEASAVIESMRSLEEERYRHRIEDELRLAQQIQRNLLPTALPECGWLRAAGSSRASRTVGGDYYDLLALDNGDRAIIMADVSGKGVSAALLASLIQGALFMGRESISEMLERLNQFLLDRTGGERYATLFFGRLATDGTLTYANAGHCPPLVVHATGGIDSLPATATPVGLIEDVDFPVESRKLSSGDKLIIYSDGFSENLTADCIRGFETFGAVSLHDALAVRGDEAPEDDQTLLVVEYRAGTACS